MSVITLDKPVKFNHAENDPVKLIVMLLSNHNTAHIKVLEELVDVLAGHGYNLTGVSVPTRFHGEKGVVEGNLLLVMWENHADPIITGREQLGYSKIFDEGKDFNLKMIRINNDIREQKYEAAATQIDAMIADTTVNQQELISRLKFIARLGYKAEELPEFWLRADRSFCTRPRTAGCHITGNELQQAARRPGRWEI